MTNTDVVSHQALPVFGIIQEGNTLVMFATF
jgi:hypothetical protein